jgi:preprotein translocase subunit YajC
MVFLQADAAAQTINEAAAQPVVATDAAAATTTTTTEQPDGAPVQPTGVAAFLGNPLFMFVIIIAIMYFLMIRPQRKRQKEIENFRRSLQPGMEVVTSGGLYGKIKEINNGVVVIEIAHNVNVRVDISVVFANPGAIQEGAK